jgi:hypothetical protein
MDAVFFAIRQGLYGSALAYLQPTFGDPRLNLADIGVAQPQKYLGRDHLGPRVDVFVLRYEFGHEHVALACLEVHLVTRWQALQQILILQFCVYDRRAKGQADNQGMKAHCGLLVGVLSERPAVALCQGGSPTKVESADYAYGLCARDCRAIKNPPKRVF